MKLSSYMQVCRKNEERFSELLRRSIEENLGGKVNCVQAYTIAFSDFSPHLHMLKFCLGCQAYGGEEKFLRPGPSSFLSFFFFFSYFLAFHRLGVIVIFGFNFVIAHKITIRYTDVTIKKSRLWLCYMALRRKLDFVSLRKPWCYMYIMPSLDDRKYQA